MSEKKDFYTICKVCIFANRDDNGNQTGCSLGHIDHFKNQNVKIETIKDDGPVYLRLKNTICQWARTKDWSEASKENRVQLARDEIRERSRLDMIVDFDYEHTISDLGRTLSSLKEQPVKPYQVIVSCNNLKPKFVVSLVNYVKKELANTDILWRVERPQTDLEKNHRVANATRKCKKMYFALFDAGGIVPANFFADIDVYLNDKMQHFSLILPPNQDSDNGVVIQTGLYTTLGAPEQFVGILQEMANTQERSHMIKQASEVLSG